MQYVKLQNCPVTYILLNQIQSTAGIRSSDKVSNMMTMTGKKNNNQKSGYLNS